MPKGRTRSGYRFLPDVALADIAFAARGDSLSALFEAAARALTEVMVDPLLFKTFKVTLGPGKEPSLTCVMRGEEIDRDRHALRNDVKAVTMHMFGVKKKAGRWQATVVLDI